MSDKAAPRPTYEELEGRVAAQARRIAALEEQIAKLTAALEEARRAQKRQAGPFSKNKTKDDPKKPGRKPGDKYGSHASRPQPEHVDETLDAPLPHCCPDCGGPVEETDVDDQFQTDVPAVRPHVTRFRVHVGRCRNCGHRVQGRHPRQTSDALGAADNQIGPNALSLAAHMNKELGIPYGKIAAFFATAFGLTLCRAALARALTRIGRLVEPAYDRAIELVRQSFAVYPDETGWRVAGHRYWLWVFVAHGATVFRVQPSRGFDVASEVLGEDYDGTLGCDGWSIYLQFLNAERQTCNAHLLRRCREMIEVATRGAVRFPRAVKELLQDGLALRDRRDAGTIPPREFEAASAKLEERLGALCQKRLTNAENSTFRDHLANHGEEIFTYLYDPAIEATAWPADHAIRGSTATRKISGGNRSTQGAHVHEILLTFFRTCWQRGLDAVDLIHKILSSPSPLRLAHTVFT